MNKTYTDRGFRYVEFEDYYGEKCSVQESSLASHDCIWLGLQEVSPIIMARKIQENGVGWVKYPIPKDVFINSKMHLTQEQAKELIDILQKFVDTGRL